jgi:uncharacterized protein (DUF2147 family)
MWHSQVVALGVLALAAAVEVSASAGPEGRWQTVDDRTGAPRAVIRVRVEDARLTGAIERIFARPGEDPDPICTRCEGELRGRPVLGMEILRGLRQDGDRWVGGSILDPDNRKTYKATVWLDGHDRLRVRGYWGPFYRTQIWHRSGDDDPGEPATTGIPLEARP